MSNKSKKVVVLTSMILACLASSVVVACAAPEWGSVYKPIVELIDSLLGPMLLIVGAVGTIFCVFLGVKFAKSDDPQEHEKAKKALKNAIIGFVLIFVMIFALKVTMPMMTSWKDDEISKASTYAQETTDK